MPLRQTFVPKAEPALCGRTSDLKSVPLQQEILKWGNSSPWEWWVVETLGPDGPRFSGRKSCSTHSFCGRGMAASLWEWLPHAQRGIYCTCFVFLGGRGGRFSCLCNVCKIVKHCLREYDAVEVAVSWSLIEFHPPLIRFSQSDGWPSRFSAAVRNVVRSPYRVDVQRGFFFFFFFFWIIVE